MHKTGVCVPFSLQLQEHTMPVLEFVSNNVSPLRDPNGALHVCEQRWILATSHIGDSAKTRPIPL